MGLEPILQGMVYAGLPAASSDAEGFHHIAGETDGNQLLGGSFLGTANTQFEQQRRRHPAQGG